MRRSHSEDRSGVLNRVMPLLIIAAPAVVVIICRYL